MARSPFASPNVYSDVLARGAEAPVVAAAPAPSRERLRRVCPHCGQRYPEDFRVCPRDAVELQDLAPTNLDELLGVVLGDAFCIVRAIGEGGMARVYEARHIRLKDKRFAVKVLHDTYAQSPDIVARFRREAEAASAIAHPNVVDVFDVHLAPDGRPYMVSEFLEGKD